MSEQDPLPLMIRLDLPASLQYLNVLGACLAAVLTHVPHLEEPEITSYNVQLAVHEISANIVLHAYVNQPEQGRINVVVTLSSSYDYLMVTLYDDGVPFDERYLQKPSLDQVHIHGYGLFLVQNLMDSLSYQRLGEKNCWSLKKYLSRS